MMKEREKESLGLGDEGLGDWINQRGDLGAIMMRH